MEVRTVDDVNVMDLPERTLREIRKQADDRGITITCVSSPIGKQPVSISPSIVVEQVEKASEIAHMLGTEYIRIFSFFNEQDMTIDEAIGLSSEKLSLMADRAKGQTPSWSWKVATTRWVRREKSHDNCLKQSIAHI